MVEGRPLTKENIMEPNTQPTQSGERVSHQERFTALLHHVTPQLLEESYYAIKRKAAPGVDGMTWQEYGTGLAERLGELHGRVHRAEPTGPNHRGEST